MNKKGFTTLEAYHKLKQVVGSMETESWPSQVVAESAEAVQALALAAEIMEVSYSDRQEWVDKKAFQILDALGAYSHLHKLMGLHKTDKETDAEMRAIIAKKLMEG